MVTGLNPAFRKWTQYDAVGVSGSGARTRMYGCAPLLLFCCHGFRCGPAGVSGGRGLGAAFAKFAVTWKRSATAP